jgi:hypothetical protein
VVLFGGRSGVLICLEYLDLVYLPVRLVGRMVRALLLLLFIHQFSSRVKWNV